MTDLSIIIVNKDSGELLANCVLSVVKEAGEGDLKFEIIIIDNASTDKSLKSIKDLNCNFISIIQNEKNIGFGRANNQGVEKSKGEFILFLNPDIIIKDNAINKVFDFFRIHNEVGAIGCRLLNTDGSWQRSYGNFPDLKREIVEAFIPRFFLRNKVFKGVHGYAELIEVSEVDWISGAFLLCRKELIQKIDGFDETFFLYYEDIDLCKRIKNEGFSILFFPKAQITHFMPGSVNPQTTSTVDNGESPYIYFRKYFPPIKAKFLWLIILFKTLLRVSAFYGVSIFLNNDSIRNKLQLNLNTLKFTLNSAYRYTG